MVAPRFDVAYRDTGVCYPTSSLISFSECIFAIAATVGIVAMSTVSDEDFRLSTVHFLRRHYLRFISAYFCFQFVARARSRHVKVSKGRHP